MIRRFKVGSVVLKDPLPDTPDLNLVFEALVQKMPLVRYSSLFASDGKPCENDPNVIIYEIPLIKARSNG